MARNIISLVPAEVSQEWPFVVTPKGRLDEPITDPEVVKSAWIISRTDEFPLRGLGRYSALAYTRGENSEFVPWLAELEAVSMETARNKVVYAANAISGVLSHGHTLTDEEAADIPSLRALQFAWKAKGAAYNDSLEADRGWMSGMEGWAEEIGMRCHQYEGLVALSHTTGTGRLSVRVSDDLGGGVELSFYAGPAKEGEEGRLAAQVAFDPRVTAGGMMSSVLADASLLKGRPDRIGLLWEIDRALGGIILSELERMAEYPEGYFGQAASRILLDAKKEAEQPWPPQEDPFLYESGGTTYSIRTWEDETHPSKWWQAEATNTVTGEVVSVTHWSPGRDSAVYDIVEELKRLRWR